MNSEMCLRSSSSIAPDNDGERMVPEISNGCTFWEHVYRYAFACRFVAGRRVLDIACGEGYGAAALLRAGAASVVGVDTAEDICRHAHNRYGIEVNQGTAEDIPLPSTSIDVVVSFETIEHVRAPKRFLDECARVLKPDGELVISTPNKVIYSRPGNAPNRHHCSEMTEAEFTSALRDRFHLLRIYSQRPHLASWWTPRILASDRTFPLRGFGRVRRLAQYLMFPDAVREPTTRQRERVEEAILGARSKRASPLNPFAVRPVIHYGVEQPTYFVAHLKRLN